jgi:hypothetical protein
MVKCLLSQQAGATWLAMVWLNLHPMSAPGHERRSRQWTLRRRLPLCSVNDRISATCDVSRRAKSGLRSKSLRREPQACEIGSYNRSPDESACLHRFAIICLGQCSTRNVPAIVPCRSKRRSKMCEHEILRARALCHGTKISCQALPVEALWGKTTSAVRAQNWVYRRMDDDISSVCQAFHLIGRRVSPRRSRHIVAGIASDHDASGWSVYSIGCMACDVCGADCADLYVAGGPNNLWLLFRLECNDVGQIGRTAGKARTIFRTPLGNLS